MTPERAKKILDNLDSGRWRMVEIIGQQDLRELLNIVIHKAADPVVLNLCEQEQLTLKPHQPYLFIVDESCTACCKIADSLQK